MQLNNSKLLIICLTGTILFSIFISCYGDEQFLYPESVILPENKLTYEQYDESITVSDVFSQLSQLGEEKLSPNISLLLYNAKPGAVLSPDAILPVPEVIYITKGTARITTDEEEFTAVQDEVIYIPENKTRKFENQGEDDLIFYSIIDWNMGDSNTDVNSVNNSTIKPIFINNTEIQSEKTVEPQEFGNISDGESFTFYRLLHPSNIPYDISYDIGTIFLSEGTIIPDHYIDGSFQLFSVLSGTANISVGCSEQLISTGDLMYVAPGALMNITADKPLHMMVITHPFYQAEHDHQITGACDTRITQ